jgi:acyl-CoA reductase-like NAD-dependent aldehyde dehydrogenase
VVKKKQGTAKKQPSWKSSRARSHRKRLEKMSDRSVIQVHRAATIIIEDCTKDRIETDDKMDVAYALDLMADCMGIVQHRLQIQKNKTGAKEERNHPSNLGRKSIVKNKPGKSR